MVKLKDIVENVQIGKVYTDKDRPPFKAEGTCGYGIGGKLGEEPAGPHLLKKKKKDVNEKVDTEMKKIYQLLIKYGNNAKDAAAMIKKNLKYVNKTYRNSTPRGKAIALVGLSSIGESVDFKKAHKKFKETGELPPHLKKLVKDLDKVKVKHKVKNIVVPGLEWMSKIKEAVNEQQKRQASDIRNKFDQAYLKFSREVRDVIKMMDRSTGDKTDGKIIDKAYSKGLIPLDKLMQSWAAGQYKNPNLSESVNEDVYIGYYKNKKVKVNAKSDKDAKKQIISKLKIPKGDLKRASMINHTKNKKNRHKFESVNEAGMELNKLKDAIKMFQKKIEKQGRVTNARDEEHLKNLIKVYKQMGGKGVKESVNENVAPNHDGKAAPYGSGYKEIDEAKIQVQGIGMFTDDTLRKKIIDLTKNLQKLAKKGEWSKSSENAIRALGRMWGAYQEYDRK